MEDAGIGQKAFSNYDVKRKRWAGWLLAGFDCFGNTSLYHLFRFSKKPAAVSRMVAHDWHSLRAGNESQRPMNQSDHFVRHKQENRHTCIRFVKARSLCSLNDIFHTTHSAGLTPRLDFSVLSRCLSESRNNSWLASRVRACSRHVSFFSRNSCTRPGFETDTIVCVVSRDNYWNLFSSCKKYVQIYIPLRSVETGSDESRKNSAFKSDDFFVFLPCGKNTPFYCHKSRFRNKTQNTLVNKNTQPLQTRPTNQSTKNKNTTQELWRTNLLFAAFQAKWILSIATELPSSERTSSSRSRDPAGLASRFCRSARFRLESPRRHPPRSLELSRRRWSWSSTWSLFIPHPNRPSRPRTKLRQPALTKTPVPAGCLPSRTTISPRPRPHPWLDGPSFRDWKLTPRPPDNHLPASWDLVEESRWKWELHSGDTGKSQMNTNITTP